MDMGVEDNPATFCKSARVYRCVSGDIGLWSSGLTDSFFSTIVTIFVLYLAFQGSFVFAGQPNVPKMFGAASKTLRGQKAKPFDYLQLRSYYRPDTGYVDRYKQAYVPDGTSYAWYLSSFGLLFLIAFMNNFAMSVVEPLLAISFFMVLLLGRSTEHANVASRSVVGGIASAIVVIILTTIYWNVSTVQSTDSPVIYLIYLMVFWMFVTFFAWIQKPSKKQRGVTDITDLIPGRNDGVAARRTGPKRTGPRRAGQEVIDLSG